LIIEDFKRIFKDVDMILGPTMPVTAMKLGELKNYPFFGELMDVLTEPTSIAGLPAMNIPVGLDSNSLPIGMQLIGRHFDEESLLNMAYQFEKETDFFSVIKKGIRNYKD
ncbi:Asp-tRNA(Asn)/Glu-tRNA(Gln) amidotransferase GatCAB subunit A, partial [Candidatus Roizmanbacteria bacterium]|nr:Asp-tRNA(Asn)/Glu-tRNA(Gln) amidotransferase GatCAB subunit A [Candidatus Roizmanbacteria bacterium]